MTFGYTDALNQPTKIRLPGVDENGQPREVAITDWFWRTLRSTVDILSGATDEKFLVFNYGEGSTVSHSNNITSTQFRTATIRDTNVDAPNQMPAEQEYLCYALSIDARQFLFDSGESGEDAYTVGAAALPVPNAANIGILQDRLIATLEVTQKDTFQDTVGWFASGAGPFVSGGTTGAVRTYGQNGFASKDAIDRAPLGIHIGGTEAYNGIFYNPVGTLNFVDETGATAATTVMRLVMRLVGLQKRPTA